MWAAPWSSPRTARAACSATSTSRGPLPRPSCVTNSRAFLPQSLPEAKSPSSCPGTRLRSCSWSPSCPTALPSSPPRPSPSRAAASRRARAATRAHLSGSTTLRCRTRTATRSTAAGRGMPTRRLSWRPSSPRARRSSCATHPWMSPARTLTWSLSCSPSAATPSSRRTACATPSPSRKPSPFTTPTWCRWCASCPRARPRASSSH
mmetsp:Transcript_18620/g.50048  ORF Transcript_18620/g.50048 Transcript_18620/m.50048 type:complete len:206 (-) Transcript_18620:316-933(-)